MSDDAPAVFPLGATTVSYTATDAAGNVGTASTTVIVVDTTPPVLDNVPVPVTVEQSSLAGTPVTVELPTAVDICDADVTIGSDAPLVFPLGVTTVTFRATDDSGNVAVASTTDPDARSMKDKEGRSKANYNTQLAVDDACGAIVAADVNDQPE